MPQLRTIFNQSENTKECIFTINRHHHRILHRILYLGVRPVCFNFQKGRVNRSIAKIHDRNFRLGTSTMSCTDERQNVGSKVMAKACHVTNLAECARRYGSNKQEKLIVGIVKEVVIKRNNTTGRTTTLIDVEYDFGGGVKKRKTLNLRSVRKYVITTQVTTQQSEEAPVVPETANGHGVGVEPQDTPQDTPTTRSSPRHHQARQLQSPSLIIRDSNVSTNPINASIALEASTNSTNGNNMENTTTVPSPRRSSPRIAAAAARQNTAFSTSSTDTDNSSSLPTTEAHGCKWFKDDEATKQDIGGRVPFREWSQKTTVGEEITAGCDVNCRRSRLDYFLLMFPPTQLQEMCRLTNFQLNKKEARETTIGEILKFFGIMILATRFEFQSRASLWSNTAPSKYIPAPSFGRTGMSRNRFDELFSCVRWSEQPEEKPSGMSSETYRWLLVDGFVKWFNDYRAATFSPSDLLCADESISRWYGLGGGWINIGLPMYVMMERKPDAGCEIQNVACGRSGVMLQLKLVKGAEEHEDSGELLHGTLVTKQLVLPWAHSGRIVCADSYFASVGCVRELKRLGLRFIGVVKTATREYPMTYLSSIELSSRGDMSGLVHKDDDGNVDMMSFVWMDRDRHYFISSASSLELGRPFVRRRWRQIVEDNETAPENVELTVPQPKACETYYETCGMIDRHNRSRQDDLQLERKLGTMDWSMRVNMSIFGMIVVDSWLVDKAATNSKEDQKAYYNALAEELIDNRYDEGLRGRDAMNASVEDGTQNSPSICQTTGKPRSGLSVHLTPTKRKRKRSDGSNTPYLLQGRCVVCKAAKTTMLCSLCSDDNNISGAKEPWICNTKNGRMCFSEHVQAYHNL